MLWFQKARISWVQDGDRNTAYYHRFTILKLNQGRIRMLKLGNDWVSNLAILKDHISNFFSLVFSRSHSLELPTTDIGGRRMESKEAMRLMRPSCLDEMRRAVFGLKNFGNLSPDEIQAAFYQEFWDVVKWPIRQHGHNIQYNPFVHVGGFHHSYP